MCHELKIDPVYFRDLESGSKTFEIRKDDRPFRVNDVLLLQSFNREVNEYTGSMVLASVTGIFGRKENEKEFVKEGYVILLIDLLKSRYLIDSTTNQDICDVSLLKKIGGDENELNAIV